ncbi:MAG: efflux RND transporter periplasmic adaptor subunit [Planctomycetaceae bacterium]
MSDLVQVVSPPGGRSFRTPRGMGGLCHLACLLVVVAGGCGWLVELARADTGAKGKRRPAETTPLRIEVDEARVRLMDDVQLASPRTGIDDAVAGEGDDVDPHQEVARLRAEVLEAGLKITERQASNDIEVRFARKASELAQLKYARAAEASRSVPGTVSELELKELRLSAEKSLLQVEQTEQQFTIAGLRRDESVELLNTCRIKAPFAAQVVEVLKKPGEVVREGEPILRLASNQRMRVEGWIPVSLAARVRRGQSVVVVQGVEEGEPGPAQEVSGRVMFIDLKVEPVSRKVRVWAEVQNLNGELRDGLTARMVIDAGRDDVARVTR